MRRTTQQLNLLEKYKHSYGGSLLKTRKGRQGPRPLGLKYTMHLVLRSSKATGTWSFKKKKNETRIKEIVAKFAQKHAVNIVSMANVGNHLHFQIKLLTRYGYKPFIRAITSAIAMAVTGASRWKPLKKSPKDRFWDFRPFTRVLQSFKEILRLSNYIEINRFEGFG